MNFINTLKPAPNFFTDAGEKFHEVILRQGDAIVLVDGAHSI